MTATDHAEAPEGVAQDIEAPVAEQAAVGPLTATGHRWRLDVRGGSVMLAWPS